MTPEQWIELERIIGSIESANDYGAIRFEPKVYARIEGGSFEWEVARAKRANKCSRATARMICATSWGRFQIMGFNLYGFIGLTDPIADYLHNVKVQSTAFETFVKHNHIEFSPDELRDKITREKFAKIYNGSLAYAVKIETELSK